MQLTPFCLLLTCLRVHPDRSQFFRYDSVSLSCDVRSNSSGVWKVKMRTWDGRVRPCSSGWDPTCTIGTTYPSDSGVYWCESEGEETSNSVNITITDGAVILESPALPVSEGATVTLRCRDQMTSDPNAVQHFYKDGRPVGNRSSSSGEMVLRGLSKSDEGLYSCSISGREGSLSSWLAVDASHPASDPPAASCCASVFRLLMWRLLVGTPYLLSTILLGLIHRDGRRAARLAQAPKGSDKFVMEIAV